MLKPSSLFSSSYYFSCGLTDPKPKDVVISPVSQSVLSLPRTTGWAHTPLLIHRHRHTGWCNHRQTHWLKEGGQACLQARPVTDGLVGIYPMAKDGQDANDRENKTAILICFCYILQSSCLSFLLLSVVCHILAFWGINLCVCTAKYAWNEGLNMWLVCTTDIFFNCFLTD